MAAIAAAALTFGLRPAGTPSREIEHRCNCRHGPEKQCSCSTCKRAVLTTRLAEAERQPPCHRDAARRKVQRELNEETSPRPCLRGTCGAPEEQHAALTGLDVFVIPVAEALLEPALGGEAASYLSAREEDLAFPPATPPPRLA